MLAWINVIVALTGLGIVAFIGQRWPVSSDPLIAHVVGLSAIVAIAVGVYAMAVLDEGYTLSRLGFGKLGWTTPVMALALVALFVLVFGPFAYWLVAQLGAGDFGRGLAATQQLPTPYLIVTIVVVASVEELLYRGYAIPRLSELTGSTIAAAVISVLAFGLVHVPMWGWGPALTTVLSGAILTGAYVWRQDLPALMLAHVATDLYGLVIAARVTHGAGVAG